MAHTPGPWTAGTAGPNYWINADDERTVAFIGGGDSIFAKHRDTPHEANARLIAAAPDLLAALRGLVSRMGISENGNAYLPPPDAIAAAQDAIAKVNE